MAAYLNYIMVDKNFNPVQEGFIPLNSAANGTAMEISIPGQVVREEGFVYVYLTNESNAEVYFDDFEVTLSESKVIQSNDYYPFGLQHNTSWTRIDQTPNAYKFNGGSEFNEDLGVYETAFRQYDPALGRFMGVDAMAGRSSSWSPYSFGFNNPVVFNDPIGLYPSKINPFDKGSGPLVEGYGWGGFGGRVNMDWARQYRGVEANYNVMGAQDFEDMYGIRQSESTVVGGKLYRVEATTKWMEYDGVPDETSYTYSVKYTEVGLGDKRDCPQCWEQFKKEFARWMNYLGLKEAEKKNIKLYLEGHRRSSNSGITDGIIQEKPGRQANNAPDGNGKVYVQPWTPQPSNKSRVLLLWDLIFSNYFDIDIRLNVSQDTTTQPYPIDTTYIEEVYKYYYNNEGGYLKSNVSVPSYIILDNGDSIPYNK